jgi:hypothetical protein
MCLCENLNGQRKLKFLSLCHRRKLVKLLGALAGNWDCGAGGACARPKDEREEGRDRPLLPRGSGGIPPDF